MPVKVGMVDSGCGFSRSAFLDVNQRVVAQASFVFRDGGVEQVAPMVDQLGHGSALLGIIGHCAPDAEFVVAQIFRERLTTTAAQVAASIDWLVDEQVDVINLSLGLRQDRDVLKLACDRARQKGVILVASTPARGEPVFPAAYEGVLRMTGDARCQPDEFSRLQTRLADFGAHVKGENGVVGASAATAYLTGFIAQHLIEHPQHDLEALTRWLCDAATYQGAEVLPWQQADGERT